MYTVVEVYDLKIRKTGQTVQAWSVVDEAGTEHGVFVREWAARDAACGLNREAVWAMAEA